MTETSTSEILLEHEFMPKHELLSEEEERKVLERFGVQKANLPKIFRTDPAIRHLKAKQGNIIKITRDSKTAEKTIYYRVVV